MEEENLIKTRGPCKLGAGLPASALGRTGLVERVPTDLCTENAEADASPKK
jgi:hypothetical protein